MRRTDRFIHVNLLSARITWRPLLKLPRCPACTPLNRFAHTNLRKVLFRE
jgi:hypothetical protein